ncbi:hypothetical protein CWI38_0182p0070 [Hamiltosporidium tvaerminnensis]|uniref:C2H2-type domain-containing protein n=1 Tax=Hamiltosporidium tvaerminnensis TaxID=1176355 RepID=A0A4Q9LVL4_9MICR|nr:hypothetical protein CWI38_0646p0030 [Hamiltosporidium tvaerminnensis]TBU19877.1 hypothetical protein CWI38_0182p0070 [Hamiltosporidium tvaerminnensis]
MNMWFSENSMSVSTPFLERSLKKMENICTEKKQTIKERECCAIFLMSLIPLKDSFKKYKNIKLFVRGYQKNENYRMNNIEYAISAKFKGNEFIINEVSKTKQVSFSCYHETCMTIFIICNKIVKCFYCKYNGCKLVRGVPLLLYEVDLFVKNKFYQIASEPSFEIRVKTINLKATNTNMPLHYNMNNEIVEYVKKHNFTYKIDEFEFDMDEIKCVFCFRSYETLENLIFHINHFHLNYYAIQSQNCIIVTLSVDKTKYDVEFCFFSKNYKRKHTTRIFSRYCYEYFESETMEKLGTKKNAIKWWNYLSDKKIAELVDISPSKILLMQNWNNFISDKRIEAKEINYFTCIKEFVLKNEATEDILDFLYILAGKSVISLEELVSIVNEKVSLI